MSGAAHTLSAHMSHSRASHLLLKKRAAEESRKGAVGREEEVVATAVWVLWDSEEVAERLMSPWIV